MKAIAIVLLTWPMGAHACAIVDVLDAFPAAQPPDATCAQYLAPSGATGTSCHWRFDLRDPAAERFAADLWSTIQTCRPGTALGPDTRVNHPDSFDLLEWHADRALYRVSVKDKGAQRATFVFLSQQP